MRGASLEGAPPLGSVTTGAPGRTGPAGAVLSNDDPAFDGWGRGRNRMIALYMVALLSLLLLAGLALGSTVVTASGLLAAVAALAVVLAVSRRAGGQQRRTIPTRLTIFPDRVEATFPSASSPPGPSTTLRLPFAAVESMWPASRSGGREHFWVPAGVRANYARIRKFEPTSVRASLHGPPLPPGCVQEIVLATRNFGPLRDAYLRAVPTAKELEGGMILGPEY